jgi:hypothetical protein
MFLALGSNDSDVLAITISTDTKFTEAVQTAPSRTLNSSLSPSISYLLPFTAYTII